MRAITAALGNRPALMNIILPLALLLISPIMPDLDKLLYKFSAESADEWRVQDDTVMGGESRGYFAVTDEGYGRFYGRVSLANNGGFSSIVHTLDTVRNASDHNAFILRLKGDGKAFTFRVKDDADHRYYYQATFPTTGSWQTVRLPFSELEAVHHGEKVDAPPYTGDSIFSLQLLIGNKRAQAFEFIFDRIGTAR